MKNRENDQRGDFICPNQSDANNYNSNSEIINGRTPIIYNRNSINSSSHSPDP